MISSRRILRACVLCLFVFVHTQVFGQECARVVSLAPSVTETLFAIGLGDSVVGVTRFDSYPPEVKTKTNIGGFLDPSIETIYSLKPSHIFGVAEQKDLASNLEKMNFKTDLLEHRNIGGILEGITKVGKLCDRILEAQKLRKELEDALAAAKTKTSSLTPIKVAIVVSRNYKNSTIKDLYLSGADGYYDTLLSYVGAENVFKKALGSISATSLEGLVSMNPDIIIEMLPTGEIEKVSKKNLMRAWNNATMLKAVKQNKVFLIDNDWATIPGPRIVLMLNAFLNIVHPEVH